MTDTVHGLTKATYRETLRGLQNQQMRVVYNGKAPANFLSYDDLQEEIERVQGILSLWDTDNGV
jgi:hypothetical protein